MGEIQCPQCREYVKVIEVLRCEIEVLRAAFEAQSRSLKALEEEVARLKGQISKNSRNSSKPPSTDGYERPQPKSLREKSGRKIGGQEGHKGETLKMVVTPDCVIGHQVERCEACGKSLVGEEVLGVERRQVFDLPPVRLHVTEHQAETKGCSSCGHLNRALFPVGVVSPAQYGQHIKSVAVYLLQYQLLPYDRTGELMQDLFSAPMSVGTLANTVVSCSTLLEPAVEKIRTVIHESEVAHFDESGGSVEGKLWWFHVASTESATFYDLHEKRGADAMNEIGILVGFTGRAIHDFWKPYLGYNCKHGLCNAHLLRELVFIHEETGQRWAGEMIGHLMAIKNAVRTTKTMADHLSGEELCRFEQGYSRILEIGRSENPVVKSNNDQRKRGRPKKSKAQNLIDRFEKYPKEILAFMYDFRVPFDNNLSERDIRMLKVRMKISGAFRSEKGGKAFCRIRSYISTARKNAANVIDAITNAFAGQPFIPSTSRVT